MDRLSVYSLFSQYVGMRLTSVRDALVSTEAELAVGGETTRVEISSDGIAQPTDGAYILHCDYLNKLFGSQ